MYGEVDIHDPTTQIPRGIEPLFDTWMRDPHICAAPDRHYYLTGTTRSPDSPDGRAGMGNDGIRVWRSLDLKSWEPLGLVWSLDRDATWQRWYQILEDDRMRFVAPEDFNLRETDPNLPVRRSVWAPEIHFVKSLNTFVIVASMNYHMGLPYDAETSPYLFGGIFALRSTTGRAEGPYEATSPGPLTNLIDACLFEDEDESLYLLGLNDHLMKLKPDLSGLAGDLPLRKAQVGPGAADFAPYVSLWDVPKLEQRTFEPEMCSEGGYLFKHDGRYHLCVSAAPRRPADGQPATYAWKGMFTSNDRGPYNVVAASSDNVWGPYGERYTAITHGGHGNFFQDREGRWWACVFNPPRDKGTYGDLPACRPAIVPMQWKNGRIHPAPTNRNSTSASMEI